MATSKTVFRNYHRAEAVIAQAESGERFTTVAIDGNLIRNVIFFEISSFDSMNPGLVEVNVRFVAKLPEPAQAEVETAVSPC